MFTCSAIDRSVRGLTLRFFLLQPAGPLVITMDSVGLWQEPWIWGRIPFVGPALNVIYNWKQQRLTYASVGEFLSNHLGPGEGMRGKRVGLLEDASKQ